MPLNGLEPQSAHCLSIQYEQWAMSIEHSVWIWEWHYHIYAHAKIEMKLEMAKGKIACECACDRYVNKLVDGELASAQAKQEIKHLIFVPEEL